MRITPSPLSLSDGVFNTSSTYVLAAGGFLVPLKDRGTLTLFDLDLRPPVKHVLSDNSEDAKWFYHRVLWADMNGDGLMDMVTCRARTHLFGVCVCVCARASACVCMCVTWCVRACVGVAGGVCGVCVCVHAVRVRACVCCVHASCVSACVRVGVGVGRGVCGWGLKEYV